MMSEEIEDMRKRAWRLFAEGNGSYEKCSYERARELYLNALILMTGLAEKTRGNQDMRMLLEIRHGYGNASMATADYEAAKKAYMGTLETYSEMEAHDLHDTMTADSAAQNLSHIARQADKDIPAAISHMNRAALLEKKIIEERNLTGDWRRFRRTLAELSRMKASNGDADTLGMMDLALSAAKRTADSTGEDPDMREEARLLNEKGVWLTDIGETDRAEDVFSAALDLISGPYRRSTGEDDQRIYSSILMNRAMLSDKAGNTRRAADYYGLALSPMTDLAERTGMNEDRSTLRYLLIRLGMALDLLGETEEAYGHYLAASKMSEELGTYDMRPELLGKLQEILLSEAKKAYAAGDTAGAQGFLMNAYRSERDTANHSGLLRDWKRFYETLTLLGRINLEDEDYEASLDWLSEAWHVLLRIIKDNPEELSWKGEEVKLALQLSAAWDREENYRENPSWPTSGKDWMGEAEGFAEELSTSSDPALRRMKPWLFMKKAELALEGGDRENALLFSEKAADMLSGMEDTESLRMLASVTGFLGKLTDDESPAFREELYRKSASIFSRIADETGSAEDRREAERWLMLLARELTENGETDRAEETLIEAFRNAADEESADLMLSELTDLCRKTDRLPLLRERFEERKDRFGEESGARTRWLTLLTSHYKDIGDPDKTVAAAREAADAFEGMYDDRSTARDGLIKLSDTVKEAGRIEDAFDLAESALRLAERAEKTENDAAARKALIAVTLKAAGLALDTGKTDDASRMLSKVLPLGRERSALYDTPEENCNLISLLFMMTDAGNEGFLEEALALAERERNRVWPKEPEERKVKDGEEKITVRIYPPEGQNEVLKSDRMMLRALDGLGEDFILRSADTAYEILTLTETDDERASYMKRIDALYEKLSEKRMWKEMLPHLRHAEEAAEILAEGGTPESLDDLTSALLHLARASRKTGSADAKLWNDRAWSVSKKRQDAARESVLSVRLRAEAIAEKGEIEWMMTEDAALPIERYREAWNTEFESAVRDGSPASASHMIGMLTRTEKFYGLMGREREGEDFVLSRFRDLSERLGHGPWETLPEARAFRERTERETGESLSYSSFIGGMSLPEEESVPTELPKFDMDSLLSGKIGGSLSDSLGDLSALMIDESVTAGSGTDKPELIKEIPASGGEKDPRITEAEELFAHATKGWINNKKELRKALSIFEEVEKDDPSQETEAWIEKIGKMI